MSNINTVADAIYKQNNGQPIVMPAGTFSTPGHFQFSIGASAALVTVSNPMATADTGQPFPNRSAQALPFIVKAGGTFTLGGNSRVQIDINQGTGLSPAIATTGLLYSPVAGAPDNWLLIAELLWDATSTNLRGIYYGFFGSSNVAQAAVVGTSPAALSNLQFNVAVTNLNPNPNDTLSLTEFSIDWL